MSMRKYFFSLFVCCMTSIMSFASDENGIFPYRHVRDRKAVAKLLADNYSNVVSNSVFDPDNKTNQTRMNYAIQRVEAFGCAEKKENAVYSVLVLRQNNQTVGYVQYAVIPRWIFPGGPIKGRIEQLAVDKQYRGQKFGEQLCQKALNEFAEKKLRFAEVLTTTDDVGEKFYCNKLGFKFYDQISTFPIKTSTTYFWRKYFQPRMTWSELIIKCMMRK